MARLFIDAAYAVLSISALVLVFVHTSTQGSMGEFIKQCKANTDQIRMQNTDLKYRELFTIKYYAPELWCGVSWILVVLLSNKWHMLVLGNALVASASFLRKILIHLIFGRLTMGEAQNSYDRILNFVLFKVVSVRATLDADWEDLAIWTISYCCFGALYLIGGLARDHLESIHLSPANSGIQWGLITLLSLLGVSALGMCVLCWIFLRPLFSILVTEALTILLDVFQTLVKYATYTWDSDSTEAWESKSDIVLACEFGTDICILLLTLSHYTHILFINGVSLNVVSALVFLNIRSISNKLIRKMRRLAAFRKAVDNMKCWFPDATKEEIIKFNDRCSICREVLITAKKLPCDHLFHRSCLRAWLVRHLSCPTCRISLSGSGDMNQWVAGTPASDTTEHGTDLLFAAGNSR